MIKKEIRSFNIHVSFAKMKAQKCKHDYKILTQGNE